jgi:hypothetical protein
VEYARNGVCQSPYYLQQTISENTIVAVYKTNFVRVYEQMTGDGIKQENPKDALGSTTQ